MYNIFESYWKNEVRGIFDEKITPQEAHKQLLILNEANMFDLFSKKNIAFMKRLTEGFGWGCNVKFDHPFQGFDDSLSLIHN